MNCVSEGGFGTTPLLSAIGIKDQSLAIVDLLLRSKASVNQGDARGNTPLHEAVVQHKPDIVRRLLEAHADPMLRNVIGMTPCGELRMELRPTREGRTPAMNTIEELLGMQ